MNKIMESNLDFRLISKCEKGALLVLLKDFVKEHEKYQEEDIDTNDIELDDDEERWIWLDSKIKNASDYNYEVRERTFYPIGLFYNGNDMIGFCILCNDITRWIILEFSIKPHFRNKGIGSKFAKMVIDFCVEVTKDESELTSIDIEAASNVNNEGAHRFWNFLGFETIEHNIMLTDRTLYGVGLYDRNVYHVTM